jgi:diguanylate cyclase (GGDEF)-like protein
MTNTLGATSQVDARKRRVYLVLLSLGAAGSLLALAVDIASPGTGPAVSVASSVTLVVIVAFGVLTRRGIMRLATLEWGLLVAFTLVVLFNLTYGLYLAPGNVGAVDGARSALHWVPVLFVFSYIAFDAGRAELVAFGVFVAVLATVSPSALMANGGPLGGGSALALVQVFVAYAVMLVALSFFAGMQQRLSQWRETAQEMRRLALTDALTGLANRRWAEEQLEEELARAERYGHGFAVVMLDIDHFKVLNDTHGHPAGDAVLVDLSEQLRRMVRATDQVARWGGEEFLILAPETPLEAAAELAEALRVHVAAGSLGAGRFAMTVSLGVAGFRAGDSVAHVIDRADAALYRAKRGGRNRIEVEGHPDAVAAEGDPAPGA